MQIGRSKKATSVEQGSGTIGRWDGQREHRLARLTLSAGAEVRVLLKVGGSPGGQSSIAVAQGPLVMRLQTSQVAAHADPRPSVHAEGRFALPDGPQSGGDFSILKHPEPASDVVRRVPRNVGERRQGERGNSGGRRLLSGVIKQSPAQPPSGATGIDRYLLDVHAAVDHVGDGKTRRPVIRAGYHPQAAFSLASCERLWMP
jgi:hypothetical protein